MVQSISTVSGLVSATFERTSTADERRPTTPGTVPAPERAPRPADNENRVGQVEREERPEAEARGGESRSLTRPGVRFNDDAGRFVYVGIDPGTTEVVRQFPSEQVLRQLAYFRDTRGELVDETT